MPHVEVKYSDDLTINTTKLFKCIEATMNKIDPSTGACKSRAYPTAQYQHSHIMVNLWLLKKEHRDGAFNQLLLDELQTAIKDCVPDNCFISLQLYYRDDNYRTIE